MTETLSKEHDTTPTGSRSGIEQLVDRSRAEGLPVVEIRVWEGGKLVVPHGEVGLLATESLNGCHVTVLAARSPAGELIATMTDFPPEIGTRRYREAMDACSVTFKELGVNPEVAISLTDARRPVRETDKIGQLFPDIPVQHMTYATNDSSRRANPDSGRCVACWMGSTGNRRCMYYPRTVIRFSRSVSLISL